jgi:hypothetical protein
MFGILFSCESNLLLNLPFLIMQAYDATKGKLKDAASRAYGTGQEVVDEGAKKLGEVRFVMTSC